MRRDGCLAGPVFAAAVILPPGFAHPLLNDSKKMSEKNRYLMRDVILRDAVAWAVAEVSPEEIDRINILNASFAGMSRAVERLSFRPGLLLIDGNRFRSTLGIPFVHGAVSGFCGETAVLRAGDAAPWELCGAPDRGAEAEEGTTSFIPPFIAAAQAAAAIKILARAGETPQKTMLWFDLARCSMQRLKLR